MLSMGRRRRRGKCYSPQVESKESKPMNILLLVSVEKAAQCACCRGGKSSRLVLGQLGLSTTSQLERSVCKPTIDLCTNKLGEGAPKETSLHTALASGRRNLRSSTHVCASTTASRQADGRFSPECLYLWIVSCHQRAFEEIALMICTSQTSSEEDRILSPVCVHRL